MWLQGIVICNGILYMVWFEIALNLLRSIIYMVQHIPVSSVNMVVDHIILTSCFPSVVIYMYIM
jgi:hypothetical protein